MNSPFTIQLHDGDSLDLPGKKIVCPRCDGEGRHTNPAIDGNGLTREDFEEDPDFKEDYLSGVYDITCEECHGLRVITVVDEERLSEEQKQLYNKHLEDEDYNRREREGELRWGY